VNRAPNRSQRSAAALFLVVTTPLAVAIASAGGLAALAPLLLLVLPILVSGRAPGIAALDRIRERTARRERAPRRLGPNWNRPSAWSRPTGLLHAGPLAGRGPPRFA
jgi:hypothetical protein